MTTTMGNIRIGTSNGHMTGNKASFPSIYQSKSRLHYYSIIFNTIEVNKSFYKTPLFSTYAKWAQDTSPGFQFTLKLSKQITHEIALNADLTSMDQFLKAAAGIDNKKGCILIQFPGKIKLEHFNFVEQILEQLSFLDAEQQWRKAIEFRDDSWYIGETTELLNEYLATMVMHDFAKGKVIITDTKTNFVYLRLHGPTGNYQGSYSDSELNEKATLMREFSKSGKDVYAYFNNTAGNAFENAIQFQSMITDGNDFNPLLPHRL